LTKKVGWLLSRAGTVFFCIAAIGVGTEDGAPLWPLVIGSGVVTMIGLRLVRRGRAQRD
jgi:hypothetical protein